MSKPIRIFLDNKLEPGQILSITAEHRLYHYLCGVMRLQISDTLAVVNGRDGVFQANITQINRRAISLVLQQQITPWRQPRWPIYLAFAPIKKDDLLAKTATELDISGFIPVLTQYATGHNFRVDKFMLNVQEAVEQCERPDLPFCSAPTDLTTFLQSLNPTDRLLFADENQDFAQSTLKSLQTQLIQPANRYYILIGPEGGFSPQEQQQIHQHHGVIGLSLGPNILRAETATGVAISLLYHCLDTIG